MRKQHTCPVCNSDEFVTQPNQYDVLVFTKNGFETQTTEQIDDYQIFCRECSAEVDVSKSDTKVLLK